MWSNHPELTRNFAVSLPPQTSKWFGLVEPPRTLSKPPCRPASLSISPASQRFEEEVRGAHTLAKLSTIQSVMLCNVNRKCNITI